MRTNLSRNAWLGVSLAAMSLVLALPPAKAQEGAPAKELVLPPLPEVSTTPLEAIETPREKAEADPKPAEQPAAVEAAAPAATPEPEPAPVVKAEPAPVAPEPAPVQKAQEPAPVVAPVTAAVDTVRQSLEAQSKDFVARNPALSRKEREAIAAFYAARAYAPIWSDNGAWTPAAKAVLARLEHAGEDGLDLKATPLPVLQGATDEARASIDLALSLAVVNYARQASGSRVDPQTIAKLITEKPEIADTARILAAVTTTNDAAAALQGFNPQQPGYIALRTKLADMRAEKAAAPARIEAGPVLKVGMKDPRVPLIRERFKITADPAAPVTDELLYDTRIAAAVSEYQRDHGLPASGQLTARTVVELSGGDPARLEAEILANMERWRWMPRSYAPERIEVNIPDYTVHVMRDGNEIHRARVIVGKPTTPTPVFSNRMQFIEVNPYWNVPESIIKKEMMPRLAQDPTYLQRMGYEVTTSRSGRMIVRQPPGERNALGRIKFMFPNEHAVYLHDTPTRGLFVNDRRAYSHGCVRVDQPFKFAEIVLGKENGWNEDKVKRLIGGKNQTIHLPRNIEIHIEYFTAFVDPSGKLQLRDDIYGYSRKLKLALGLQA